MSEIWNENSKFNYFLTVELFLIKILEEENIITKKSYDNYKNVKININRINDIEQIVNHDVIAFCDSITEQVKDEFKSSFHFGVTSSDIIDTALSLQIKDALNLIINEINILSNTLKQRADKDLFICIGRSHGRYAEPMIFAQKWLSFFAELQRLKLDFDNYYKNHLTMQCSGAVGNYTVISPEIELKLSKLLNLNVETSSTQVIPRDRIARLTQIFSLLAVFLERISVELRLLQHSDVDEVYEHFKENQKGSSIMPHKKNPISAENLTGISRLIKSRSQIALENCVLWHERDISHSSTERIFLPEIFELSLYAIRKLNSLCKNLIINVENIKSKVINNPYIMSAYVLYQIIKVDTRSKDFWYKQLQKIAFESIEKNINWNALLHNELKKLNVNLNVIQSLNDLNIKNFYLNNYIKIKNRTFANI